MLAELLHSLDEAVGNAVLECFIARRRHQGVSVSLKVCVNQKLDADFVSQLFRVVKYIKLN